MVYPVSNCVGRGPLVLWFSSADLDADIVWFQWLDSAHLVEAYGSMSLITLVWHFFSCYRVLLDGRLFQNARWNDKNF